MVAEAARRLDEKAVMKQMGVEHWVHDVSFEESLELLVSKPTVNIEGPGRRLYRSGRKNRPAASRRSQNRHAPRA